MRYVRVISVSKARGVGVLSDQMNTGGWIVKRNLLWGMLLGFGLSAQAAISPWALIKTTTPGPPVAIGKVSNGCINGAKRLPESGTGYVSIRRHRNRYYGHPETLKVIQGLGEKLALHSDRLVMIGDLSQPRGGRMSSMHRSHQNGMDADVWFTLADSVADAKKMAPEGRDPRSMLQKDRRLLSERWGDEQLLLIRTAAENPRVERIFVNPGIKLALCASQGMDTDWLRKLRPWWGHDAHFHVRLKCPQGSPDCRQQSPVPAGTGCGKELASWFKPRPAVKLATADKRKKTRKKPRKKTASSAVFPQCKPVLSYRHAGKIAAKE
jgi:penicillin-insensitive murein endopeptidase